MQILWIEEGAYSIIAGLFSFVARAYDAMITLSHAGTEAGTINSFSMSDIATVMYTIAGVFMLFRVTIALINMLINPDAIGDGKAGAGKLVVRIVTSILLLIAFIPNGWVFGDDGILNRLEGALLAPGGLIERVMPDSIAGAGGDVVDSDDNSNSSSSATESANTINDGINTVTDTAEKAVEDTQNTVSMNNIIENVYADGDNYIDCYYSYRNKPVTQKVQGEKQTEKNGDYDVNTTHSFVHIRFYNEPISPSDSGRTALCTEHKLNGGHKCSDFSYSIILDNDLYRKLAKPKLELIGTAFANGWQKKCPQSIDGGTVYYNAKAGSTDTWKNGYGYVGGWHSHSHMIEALKSVNATYTGEDADKYEKETGISTYKNAKKEKSEKSSNPLSGLVNYEPAVNFAQMTMGTFITCNENNCDNLKKTALVTNGSQITDAMKHNELNLEFVPALIAGVGILVWVLVLCVDIIVRRFKLLLLQMIAPIPVISYVDPNDQMFDKWRKMYLSTYVDLFIKLIAISFAIYLLEGVTVMYNENDELLLKFFYIVAILVFAKGIPSMISEVFGIKSMGGSFKDITGMAKAAAGFGAGSAIGGIVGFATGKGAGRLTGLVKGAAMGAGAGSKGKVFGGSQAIAKSNYVENAAKASGMNFFQRKFAALGGTLGLQDAYEKAEKDKKKNDEFVAAADSLDKEAGNRVQQAISTGGYKTATGKAKVAAAAIERFVQAQNIAHRVSMNENVQRYSWDADTHTYTDNLTGKIYDTDKIDSYDDAEFSAVVNGYESNANISFYEAQSQLYGAELTAKTEIINLTREDSQALKSLGINQEGVDILSDRLDVADVYAKRAGLGAYSKDKKAEADKASRKASKDMINSEAAHLYSKQK